MSQSSEGVVAYGYDVNGYMGSAERLGGLPEIRFFNFQDVQRSVRCVSSVVGNF